MFTPEELEAFRIAFKTKADSFPTSEEYADWVCDQAGDIDLVEQVLPPAKYRKWAENIDEWPTKQVWKIEEAYELARFGEVVSQ